LGKPEITLEDTMPIKESVTIEQVLEVLNRAVKADPEAMTALFATRVPVNVHPADITPIQVQEEMEGHSLSLLGLLNGIFGADEMGWGAIAAVWSDTKDSRLLEFRDNGRR
jgi:hypothetical protein